MNRIALTGLRHLLAFYRYRMAIWSSGDADYAARSWYNARRAVDRAARVLPDPLDWEELLPRELAELGRAVCRFIVMLGMPLNERGRKRPQINAAHQQVLHWGYAAQEAGHPEGVLVIDSWADALRSWRERGVKVEELGQIMLMERWEKTS